MKKNLLLTDFPPADDWTFGRALEEGTNLNWHYLYRDGRMRVPRWKRLWNYLTFPLYVLLRYDADYIVAWQQFYGLFYAFYSRIFTPPVCRKQKLYILTFIYKEKIGVVGRVYYRVMKFILGNDIIKHIIVYSQNEVDYYSSLFPQAKDKFRAMTFAMDYLPAIAADEVLRKEKYIFATGRSNRDYAFLVETLRDTQYKVKIACRGLTIKSSDNIEIMQNVFGEEMHKYMANCHIVAIPLRDLNVSSGQLVILQALQLGKPIVITANKTVADYVDDGRTGYIVENSPSQWLEKIDLLYSDDEAYTTMAEQEKKTFSERFSVERLGADVAQVVTPPLP